MVELADLLAKVSTLDAVDADRRIRGIHHYVVPRYFGATLALASGFSSGE